MSYSSVWTRLPAATVPVMIGSIVALPHVGQHAQHDFAAALDQAEDRRLLLRQRAPSGRALQPAPAPEPPFWPPPPGWPLCPATT